MVLFLEGLVTVTCFMLLFIIFGPLRSTRERRTIKRGCRILEVEEKDSVVATCFNPVCTSRSSMTAWNPN
jgi:hypothetical protein